MEYLQEKTANSIRNIKIPNISIKYKEELNLAFDDFGAAYGRSIAYSVRYAGTSGSNFSNNSLPIGVMIISSLSRDLILILG